MNLETTDDAFLIKLIADAQTDAIKELYDRYHRLVFIVALAIVGDPSLAEEITLDVFVRVWRGAKTYRADRAQVNTWLVAITRHHAIDILRRQSSHPDLGSSNSDDLLSRTKSTAPDTETHVMSSLQREQIREAVAQLPAEQREVLILAYFKGYTQRQIAELLAQPLGTIKTRIRLAMQKLRQMLVDEDGLSDKSENP